MSYGLLPGGFSIKPQAQILADIQAAELAGISANLNLQPPDPLAVLSGITSQMLEELWQLAGALYNGMQPDGATGDQLTGVAALTGTTRVAAYPTDVVGCVVNVNAGFNQGIGTMFAYPIGNPGAIFTNTAIVHNAGGSPANITVDFVALANGPTQVLANTLTQISQAITGWNTINNPTAGATGANAQSDASLRLARIAQIQRAGASTGEAIRADVLAQMQPPTTTTATLQCTVLWNDLDTTVSGVPGHAIEVVAYQPGNTSGDDTALAQLILNNKAAGIGTSGNTSKTVQDSQGNSETINFTRPVSLPIYIAVTVKANLKLLGDLTAAATAIQACLTNYATQEWAPGTEVFAKAVMASLFPSPIDPSVGVPGIVDVTDFQIDVVDPPLATDNIIATLRQIPTMSTIYVTIIA